MATSWQLSTERRRNGPFVWSSAAAVHLAADPRRAVAAHSVPVVQCAGTGPRPGVAPPGQSDWQRLGGCEPDISVGIKTGSSDAGGALLAYQKHKRNYPEII